jgi:hypothetical protein
MIDIGANLTHASFGEDLDAVVARARDAGVSTLIVTGTTVAESRSACDIAGRFDLHATAGVPLALLYPVHKPHSVNGEDAALVGVACPRTASPTKRTTLACIQRQGVVRLLWQAWRCRVPTPAKRLPEPYPP